MLRPLVAVLHRLLDFVRLTYFAVQTFSPLQIHTFKVSTNTVLHNTLCWWNHLHQKQHLIASPLADSTKRTLPLLKMSIIKHGCRETLPLASPAAFDLQGQRDLTICRFIVGSGWISGTPKSFPSSKLTAIRPGRRLRSAFCAETLWRWTRTERLPPAVLRHCGA